MELYGHFGDTNKLGNTDTDTHTELEKTAFVESGTCGHFFRIKDRFRNHEPVLGVQLMAFKG